MFLCSILHHCHCLPPTFLPFLHFPYPPTVTIYFIFPLLSYYVFSEFFKDSFLAFFPYFTQCHLLPVTSALSFQRTSSPSLALLPLEPPSCILSALITNISTQMSKHAHLELPVSKMKPLLPKHLLCLFSVILGSCLYINTCTWQLLSKYDLKE